MTPSKLEQLKKDLIAEKNEIIHKSKLNNDDLDSQGDDTDAIQAKILLELNKQLDRRAQEKISQIDEALKKIENKTYGICEDCEEDISEKRLQVSPYFKTCISCAEDREREELNTRRS